MAETIDRKGAKVIQLRKNGVASRDGFVDLPFNDKMACIRSRELGERFDLIVGDPDGERLARSLQPQELYWLLKEKGMPDALPLLRFSSPEQFRFFLDMELWDKWTFSREKAMEWLELLLGSDEQRALEHLYGQDVELLLLICKTELLVGGGSGDLISDQERIVDWDHTFDDVFFITFRDERHANLMGRFLDIIYRNDNGLYLQLMEGVKSEVESELEELCFRFRSGRLADLGFPEPDEALSIYGYLDPATFIPAGDKEPCVLEEQTLLPLPLPPEGALLRQSLAAAGSEGLYLELNYLINSALVAEEAPVTDRDTMGSVVERVWGYLTIALEWLSRGDTDTARAMLEREYLKRLFQLGYGILTQLRRRAEAVCPPTADHATNRALLGFRMKRPRFYRGLDPDHVDGYREFRDLADVRAVDEFLRRQGN